MPYRVLRSISFYAFHRFFVLSKPWTVPWAVGMIVLLVGHVTKSGEVAGPRVLEHMVDTVLYLEGTERSEHRLLRTIKNRYYEVQYFVFVFS